MSPSNTDTSGGTRYSEGKPGGWWYAPLGGLELVAPVWEMGADKYAPRDWAQGQLYSTLMNSLSRHIVAMWTLGPKARDAESGCYHAAHACWNLLCLLTFMNDGRDDLDDITPVWDLNTEEYKEWTASQSSQ